MTLPKTIKHDNEWKVAIWQEGEHESLETPNKITYHKRLRL